MPSFAVRKLEIYSLHIRNGNDSVAYGSLFERLSFIEPIERQHQFGARLVAVPTIAVSGQRVKIHAFEGDVNVNPLIFHSVLIEERTQSLRQHEVLVHKTHALFDLSTRDCVVEYNQRGAKAGDIAYALEMVARRDAEYANVTVDLNPVANADFEEELDRFARIQLASVKLARPNADWNDRFNHLTAIAAESDGQFISVEVVAARRRTLEKEAGIVGQIRELLHHPVSVFKAAKVKGIREGEKAATTISLDSYIEHQRPHVRLSPEGHVIDSDIEEKMAAYLDARREAREQFGE
jgi:hypothetical protein